MKILDISKHQAGIVLSSLTGVDGYIFRATVGSSEYDSSVEDFISQAKALGIPYGFYVADYAHNTTKAIAEANKVCDLADIHGVNFPIFFDTEYFSNEYITENYGISHTPELVQSLTTAFCERVKERGYVTGVYFNKDYHNNYYTAAYFTSHPDYVKWLARPGVNAPDIECALWQYASNAGTEFGYSGNIDKNEVIDFDVFSVFKPCNAEYQVTANNCQYFYSADVNDVVDYLDNGQIIKAHAISTGQIGGFNWIKMYLDNDPTEYYVVVLDDRLIKISEMEVGFEKHDKKYKVIASNCEYFYSADVYDVVGFLPLNKIITAHEKSTEQIGGFNWIKIYLENDETVYYVVVLPDRLVEYTEEEQIPDNGGNDNTVTKIHKALPLSGEAALNFKVVGGTAIPTNPKENTIWVNTSDTISKWSLDEKEPASPVSGQVWIETVNSNGAVSFNALKTNVIDVHTKKLYQWNGSDWVKKAGGHYQDGVIVHTYSTVDTFDIYRNGVSNYSPAVTAGSWGGGTWSSIALGTNAVTFNCGDQLSYVQAALRFQTPVDLTDCVKIRVYLTASAGYKGGIGNGGGSIRVCAASASTVSSGSDLNPTGTIYADTGLVNHTLYDVNGNVTYGSPKTNGYIDLDVSDVTGNAYIIVVLNGFYVTHFSGSITAVASVDE